MIDSEIPSALRPGAVNAMLSAVFGGGFTATAVVTVAERSQAFAVERFVNFGLDSRESSERRQEVNRPGNRPSHECAAAEIVRVLKVCFEGGFRRVLWWFWKRPKRLRLPKFRALPCWTAVAAVSPWCSGGRTMTLTRGEMRLLSKVQQSGDDGLLWTRFNSIVGRNLHRKGLIEFRMGSLCETRPARERECDS
jgi:hypothetical protein